MTDRPETIFLTECESLFPGELCWCPDECDESDTEYIRKDAVAAFPWRPYPQEKPKKKGTYLVSISNKYAQTDEWEGSKDGWLLSPNGPEYTVTAFAEINPPKGEGE